MGQYLTDTAIKVKNFAYAHIVVTVRGLQGSVCYHVTLKAETSVSEVQVNIQQTRYNMLQENMVVRKN